MVKLTCFTQSDPILTCYSHEVGLMVEILTFLVLLGWWNAAQMQLKVSDSLGSFHLKPTSTNIHQGSLKYLSHSQRNIVFSLKRRRSWSKIWLRSSRRNIQSWVRLATSRWVTRYSSVSGTEVVFKLLTHQPRVWILALSVGLSSEDACCL